MAVLAEERALNEADRIARLFRVGFEFDGGTVTDGDAQYEIPAFDIKGLASTQDPMLRLFVTKTPRRTRLRTGEFSSRRMKTSDPKVLALVNPLIELNTNSMNGVFGVKIAGIFDNWGALRLAILGCGVQLPDLATVHVDENCRLVDPNLFWILENSVPTKGKNVSRKAVQAFRATHRSLVFALKGIGAQTASLAPGAAFKNPLSHTFATIVMNPEPYQMSPSCAEYPRADLTVGLPRDVTNEQLYGVGASAKTATTFRDKVRVFACEEVVRWFAAGEREQFVTVVRNHATEIAASNGVDIIEALRIATGTCGWVWRNHRPERVSRRLRQRGPCAEQTIHVACLAERQGIGGRYSSKVIHDANVEKMVSVWMDFFDQPGLENLRWASPSTKTLAAGSGLSVRTAQRRFDEVRKIALERMEAARLLDDKQCADIQTSSAGNAEIPADIIQFAPPPPPQSLHPPRQPVGSEDEQGDRGDFQAAA